MVSCSRTRIWQLLRALSTWTCLFTIEGLKVTFEAQPFAVESPLEQCLKNQAKNQAKHRPQAQEPVDKRVCARMPTVETASQGSAQDFRDRGLLFPISEESVWNATHQLNVTANRYRLHTAMRKFLSDRGMHIVTLGGSWTGSGGGVCDPEQIWPYRHQDHLSRLSSTLGIRAPTLTNLAEGGQNTNTALSRWSQWEATLKTADLVILEYNINDFFIHRTYGANAPYRFRLQMLLALIQRLPNKPAFMYFDIPPDHIDGEHPYSPPQVSHHWEPESTLGVPMVWLVDAIAWRLEQNYLDGTRHPYCFPGHETMALVMLGALMQEMRTVCSQGVRGLDLPPIELPPWSRRMLECTSKPLFIRSGYNTTSFQLAASSVDGWSYNNDDGKWGWVAQEGGPAHIAFNVPLREGEVYIEVLRSYDNVGTAVCELTAKGAGHKGIAASAAPLFTTKIRSRWDQCYSVPIVFGLSGNVSEGNYTLHCRTDGRVFKIRSLVTC